MKKVTAVLIGAGLRGKDAYGGYALRNATELEFVAVAEPNAKRREEFSKLHGIKEEGRFTSWEELLGQPKLADAALICTQDKMHVEPTAHALEKGYHVLLEKPISTDPKECLSLIKYSEKYDQVFSICHVLRYTAFFTRLKSLLEEGKIGRLITIQHNENVGYWHQAHSFVRGNWRNSKESSPMILAKCCHDMDILLWLAGADCKRIASFGTLTHFKEENAPEGAPSRCLEGCPEQLTCPFNAERLYIDFGEEWMKRAVSEDISPEGVLQALREGPYGRCVYRCDNDVVDHQVVNIEFCNEVTAAFTMTAFTNDCTRTIKLMGTRGEIRGHMEKNEIEITDFVSGSKEIIKLEVEKNGHSGGDEGIMRDFVSLVRSDKKCDSLTSPQASLMSHMMAFAAEKSRIEGRVIEMDQFIKEF